MAPPPGTSPGSPAMPAIRNYRGIIPAIACPFTADHRIDEPALRKLASWLAGHAGVVAVMTNGHTGEVFSLTPCRARDRHAHRRRRAARALAGHLVDRLRGLRRCGRACAPGARRRRRGARRDAAAPLAALRLHAAVTRSRTSTRSTAPRRTSTSSATSTRRGRERRTRRNCSPTSRACRTCRRSRSASAT